MLVVGNWKAFVDDLATARALAKVAAKHTSNSLSIALAPAAPQVAYLRDYASKKVEVAVQDVSEIDGGAATGEVTAGNAYGAGARYAIIGHSERRARGESNEAVARKAHTAIAANLTPIVCIGEQERDADAQYLTFINEQFTTLFSCIAAYDRERVVIAYEPVWAIGKAGDKAMQPEELTEMIRYLRKQLEQFMPRGGSENTIIYGGSVDATNAKLLLASTGAEGLLVGRASTEVRAFSTLLKALK